jgi:pimeloyl-ACP methyl ester carboxylesterase
MRKTHLGGNIMSYLQMRCGRKLYYTEEGTGKPVVFIHGWKASADVFTTPSQLLTQSSNYRCIRYDQCGHIRSEATVQPPDLGVLAEDLHELIKQLHLIKPILVGWSMGGLTILEYLRRYGSNMLDRIVLVDIGPKAINDDRWPFLRNGVASTAEKLEEEVALMQKDFREFLRRYYCGMRPGFRDLTTSEQDKIIHTRLLGYNETVLTGLWQSIGQRDYLDVLGTIQCPTGIFHAGLLPACPKEVAAYYAEHIPAPTHIVCFENASHSLISEQTEKFVAELQCFFER